MAAIDKIDELHGQMGGATGTQRVLSQMNIRWLTMLPVVAGCALLPADEKASPRVYEGTLRITVIGGVEVGRLEQDGLEECVGVSLPGDVLSSLKASGPRRASVRGLYYETPLDIDVYTISIEGRPVGYQQCNYRFVFVSDSGNVVWK